MKRKFLIGLMATLMVNLLVGVIGLARTNMTQRKALPLGRYTCERVNDSSALPDLKLLSKDKYENMEKTGVYVYEAGSGRIEWLSGAISKQQVGFYVTKGTNNAKSDMIIIRDKRDVEEGTERDLSRCSLAE